VTITRANRTGTVRLAHQPHRVDAYLCSDTDVRIAWAVLDQFGWSVIARPSKTARAICRVESAHYQRSPLTARAAVCAILCRLALVAAMTPDRPGKHLSGPPPARDAAPVAILPDRLGDLGSSPGRGALPADGGAGADSGDWQPARPGQTPGQILPGEDDPLAVPPSTLAGMMSTA